MGRISREQFTYGLDSRHCVMFAHIFDMAETASKRGCSIYGDFLSENSISALLYRKNYLPAVPVLFGGFDDAERQMVAFIDEYDEADFPIGAVCLSSPMLHSLSHRDFLGSVLGLGIKREKCGDIIILEDRCYIIAHRDIASFIATNLTKVGRVGGKLLGQFDGAVLVVQGNVSHSRFLFFPSSGLCHFISEGLVSFVVSISYHGGFLNLSL